MYPSRMVVKYILVNTHIQRYYHTRLKIPKERTITNQPTKLRTITCSLCRQMVYKCSNVKPRSSFFIVDIRTNGPVSLMSKHLYSFCNRCNTTDHGKCSSKYCDANDINISTGIRQNKRETYINNLNIPTISTALVIYKNYDNGQATENTCWF